VPMERRERRLAEALAPIADAYEVIVIDCPPSLGLLTVNALCAADAVVIPLQCEYYALEGLSSLFRTIDRIREEMNPGLRIEGWPSPCSTRGTTSPTRSRTRRVKY